MATSIQLTDRELAIARGEDPNQVTAPVAPVEPVETNDDIPDDNESDSTPDDEPDDTPVPEPVADTPAETPDESDDTSAPTWITDELRELGKSYDLTEDELASFDSERAFRMSTLMFDRQLTKPAQPAAPPAKAAETPAEKAGTKDAEPELDELIDPDALEAAGFDPESVRLAKLTRAMQERVKKSEQALQEMLAWKQGFEQEMQQVQAEREALEFHEAVDGLDEKLFGKMFAEDGVPRDLDKKYHDNRAKVWDAATTLQAGILAKAQAAGKPPVLPAPKVLMQRAFQLAFPEAVVQKRTSERIAAAQKQSARRRPVGSQGGALPTRAVNLDSNDPKEIARHPDLVSFWNKAQEENGVR